MMKQAREIEGNSEIGKEEAKKSGTGLDSSPSSHHSSDQITSVLVWDAIKY